MATTRSKPIPQSFGVSYTNPFLPFSFVKSHLLTMIIAFIQLHFGLPLVFIATLAMILPLFLIGALVGLSYT